MRTSIIIPPTATIRDNYFTGYIDNPSGDAGDEWELLKAWAVDGLVVEDNLFADCHVQSYQGGSSRDVVFIVRNGDHQVQPYHQQPSPATPSAASSMTIRTMFTYTTMKSADGIGLAQAS